MNNPTQNLLDSIPDFTHWKEAESWVKSGLEKLTFPHESITSSRIASLEWQEIEQLEPVNKFSGHFGYYSNLNWRRFALAAFFADLASYSEPIEQVNFERLLFVMQAFPLGFRVWFLKTEKELWLPVGYSGWYPLSETSFELFEKHPEKVKDRMVIPFTSSPLDPHPFLYLFNFSIAAPLKKTILSKALLKNYIRDITAQKYRGLSCITVSDDGVRVAKRFGMSCSGYLNLDGSKEGIFTIRI